MKLLNRPITLFLFLCSLESVAQTDIQLDNRIDPVLKQVAAKAPGLSMFARKDGKGGYVNMALLDENSRQLKWFTCHGVAFDSIQLQLDEYDQIVTGVLDPFTFYRNYCYDNLSFIEKAEIIYRVNGKTVLQDTGYNIRVVFDSPPVKSAQSTLQKLVAIEGLIKKVYLQLRLFDSRTPRQMAINAGDSTWIRQDLAGKMIRNSDSTEYFNTDPSSGAARIVLHRQLPDRFFVYNRRAALMDSVPLKSLKYAALLAGREDVFLLYRGWLELQWQQLIDEQLHGSKYPLKRDSRFYGPAGMFDDERYSEDWLTELKIKRYAVEDKISRLIVPEEDYLEQLLANFYKNETSEISYLPGSGFSYSISYIRGQKKYELADHRHNVMAVVSDKKKGLDENADGIIETYNADLVSANDYYPFGMLQPGRNYNAENKYRYGYNGKEDDNEVKGKGNQYDYGFRIYDPRIGRFLSTDPLFQSYPYYTPYQFAGNKPVWATDLDGLEERYIQVDIVVGDENQILNVSSHEIEGLRAGWHVYSGQNGLHAYENPVGKRGIGDQFTFNISKKLTDGSVVRDVATLFVPRKPTWLESFLKPKQEAREGGGIAFTSSQALDGIRGAGSLNEFEPLAQQADAQMESIDIILDALSMTKAAVEAESAVVFEPKDVVEAIELVKKQLDLFDAGTKAGGAVQVPELKNSKVVHCKGCTLNFRDSSNTLVESPKRATDTAEDHSEIQEKLKQDK